MDKRLFPISEQRFNQWVLPVIEQNYIWKGRPPIISHYKVFCGILYVLRTGIPWRDLPKCYGNWHSVFMRYHRGNERALWWKILAHLQKQKKASMNVVICDSSTFKYHRHGGGQKGGNNLKEEAYLV
jgi:transposase